jgi:hypothetical protein
MFGVGIGVGIGRQRFAQGGGGGGIFAAYAARVSADGGVTESGECVDAASDLLKTASFLLIPSGYKSGVAYSEIPTNGNGDLTFTRTSTANRENGNGTLELMATGVPRLDYSQGICPALLLEPQRANLYARSEDFTQVVWSKSFSNVTANSTTAPDGTTTAETLNIGIDASSGRHRLSQTVAVTIGTIYTGTYYFKQNQHQWVQICGVTGYSVNVWANFNLANGTIGNIGTETTASIENVGNGWYRCRVSGVATASSSTGMEVVVINNTNGVRYPSYQSGAVVAVCFVWGAQFEAGSFPTTYIPTAAGSVTRNTDSYTRNNIYTNNLITSSGGTWFVEILNNIAYTIATPSQGLAIGDSSTTIANGFLIVNKGTGRQVIQKIISSTATDLFTTLTDTVKIAIKWNGTTADVFVNGTKQVSATAFTTTIMEFLNGSASDINRFIKTMALYSTPLSDTDCITLTT